MAVQVLIAPTTASATSRQFSPTGKNNINICVNTLQNSETVTLQIYDPANEVWSNLLINGVLQQITPQNNAIPIWNDSGCYRVVKSVTASAVGVSILGDLLLPTL